MPEELRKNLSQQLADRIRLYIEEAKLPDGELFMTEAEVADQFEVSRAVARDAVGRLQAIGLLEGRQRKGLIVRRPDPVRLFSASLPFLAKSKQDVSELSQLRYVLEVGAIELAVKNASNDQITQLMSLADQMRTIKSGKLEAERANGLDFKFHSLILEMTGSSIIAGMQRVLVDFFRNIADHVRTDPVGTERIAWEHIELAVAIRDRDIERARALIRMQLHHYLPVTVDKIQSTADSNFVE